MYELLLYISPHKSGILISVNHEFVSIWGCSSVVRAVGSVNNLLKSKLDMANSYWAAYWVTSKYILSNSGKSKLEIKYGNPEPSPDVYQERCRD